MRKLEWNKKSLWRLAAILLAACLLLPRTAVPVEAHVFNNAYTYYQTNGDSVKFWKTSETDGEICYATMAKCATTSIRFQTLGWKASVLDLSGARLQTIYFRLGGSYMHMVDSRTTDGYEYNLYGLTLSSLKKRMNTKAKQALKAGSCTIVLDACMTTVHGGTVQGSMTDSGSFTGKVYTSYDGIAGAEYWSSAAKSSLHSYFDKVVEGLFYKVAVKKSTGISSVSGGGTYLYGTEITVSAEVKKGYTFSRWKGLYNTDEIEHSFYVNEAGTMTASAAPIVIRIVYHRNFSASDSTFVVQTVKYGEENVHMRKENWEKDGKAPVGYALSQGAAEASYALDAAITNAWILKYAPKVHLYAVWPDSGENPSEVTPASGTDPDSDADSAADIDSDSGADPAPDIDSDSDSDADPDPTPAPTSPAPDVEPVPPSDDDLPEVPPVQMRFISRTYFEDASGNLVPRAQGGLEASSRWGVNASLRSLLRQVLAMTE